VNIFVDVNIFEDVFRQRVGWEASLAVVGFVANKQMAGYVSALTPPILYFLATQNRGEKAARQAVQGMLRGFVVIALDGKALEAAYISPLPDFEDALQFAAAETAGIDGIITRNKKHFRQRVLAVFNPEELIEQLEMA